MKKLCFLRIVFVSLTLILICTFELIAQDDFDFEGGETSEDEGLSLPVSGRFSFEGARQLDNPDRWILLGPSLRLVVDYNSDLGRIYFEGIERYNQAYDVEGDSQETIDEYQSEFIFREFFWKKPFNSSTLSAGKIIDTFGVMDMLGVVDKVSAVNRTDFLFADPEEFKLGQNMIKLEYFAKEKMDAGINVIPVPVFDRVADSGHPYALIENQELKDKDDEHAMEGSLYINNFFSKGLLSLYAGRFNNRSPIIETQVPPIGTPIFYKVYRPYNSIGGASNYAVEPFLFKIEAAYNVDKPLQSSTNEMPSGYIEMDEFELAIGADYNLGESGLFTIEMSGVFPLTDDEDLAKNRSVYSGALAWSNNYLNDTLKLNLAVTLLESIENLINRFQLEYFFTNNLSFGAKFTFFYINQRKEDYGFMEDYDRIDLSLNYDFNLE